MCNRRNFSTALLFLFVAKVFGISTDRQSQEEYIRRYKKMAIKEMERASIPASITLAQGILESDAGNSRLAKEANNHFGIKAYKDWHGEVFYKKDDDRNQNGVIIDSPFKKYATPEMSFIDHSDFLHHPDKPWYLPLFELEMTDYKAWAYGLLEAGYASNPRYPELLISLIERHNLTQYDHRTSASVVNIPVPRKEVVSSPESLRINNLKCTTALPGETVATIARRTNVSARRLVKYNDDIRFTHQTLTAGQIVFLQAKKANNYEEADSYHTVLEGETMVSISQKYGVRIYWLNAKNKMTEGMEPAVGARIKIAGTTVVRRPDLATAKKKQNTAKKHRTGGVVQWNEGPVLGKKEKALKVTESPKTRTETDLAPDFADEPLPSSRTHIVQKGESLWSISQAYHLDVATLKKLNQLSSNTLSVGQVLLVE